MSIYIETDGESIMDSEFGPISKIEARVCIDYNTVIRTNRFPEETIITVYYDKCIQEWSCFNVKKEDLKSVVDKWPSVPINVSNSAGNIWSKTIGEYTFRICSLTYTN